MLNFHSTFFFVVRSTSFCLPEWELHSTSWPGTCPLISSRSLVWLSSFSSLSSPPSTPRLYVLSFQGSTPTIFLMDELGHQNYQCQIFGVPKTIENIFFLSLNMHSLPLYSKIYPKIAIFLYYVTWYWVWNVYSIDTTQNYNIYLVVLVVMNSSLHVNYNDVLKQLES